MRLSFAGLSKYDFIGQLLVRIGAGALAAFHGYPALIGGQDAWIDLGSGAAITTLSSDFFLVAGLISAAIQVFGGICLIIGLFTRGASLLLAIVAGFALANTIAAQDFALSFFAYLHALLLFLGLLFIGPGRLSLDRRGI